ncbi:MAG: family 43 glycosylhydrolase [Paraprevotella sp.]|nr:family 43 glycosylhydrolase [Paraprevotella sp.]MBP3472345.1 family 43 glycosylhydrolase [Paraprevotella sp.]
MKLRFLTGMVWGWLVALTVSAQDVFRPGQEWPDEAGRHINAHGGNVLYHDGMYYWYGENRPYRGFTTEEGVEVYSSADLLHWKDEGVALAVSAEEGSPIERGCIMERPKVVYNPRTGKFVMLFHLELKGQGYAAARVGFAVGDTPVGPFRFLRSLRPNAGIWPVEFGKKERRAARRLRESDYKEWWTPEWRKAVEKGLLLSRDLPGGQMSRDMTVFVDEDGKAYHVFSSEENLTLHLAELTDDYLDYTGRYTRIAPGGQNEAPVLFKRKGMYWLITSGCTGWAPNEARMFSASSLWGPWKQHANPCRGPQADRTFGGQGTYAFPLPDREDVVLFMADVWNPDHLRDSRHIWLPVEFDAKGVPVLRWRDSWALDEFAPAR